MARHFASLLAVLSLVGGCSLARGGALREDGGVRADAPRLCSTGGCDDGNPCTADSCDPGGGCVNAPASGSCDDGILCNGADSCGAGTCSVHDGVDPCPGASLCDPATDTCIGCTSAADCPADMIGDFEACAFGDTCDTSGARSRTVTRYSCDAASRTCMRDERVETEPCMRDTDGIACGSPTTGDWSACVYSGDCDDVGSRSRSVTEYACGSGSCQPTMRVELDAVSCGRDPTEGMPCGMVTTDPYGPCMGFSGACGESGTESREVHAPTCRSRTCVTESAIESRACTRDTDGMSCGAPSCTGWGPCLTRVECTGDGIRYRICGTPQCAAGACAMNDSFETQGCTSGAGSSCVDSASCGPCHDVGSSGCTTGRPGVQDCTYTVGACSGGPGGVACGGAGAPMMGRIPCVCP
jgi:hypothetical protein